MDLRGMQLRDAYQNLVTKGSNGSIEDGKAIDIIGQILPGFQHYRSSEIDTDDFLKITDTAPPAGIVLVTAQVGNNNGGAIFAFDKFAPGATVIAQSGSLWSGGSGYPTGTSSDNNKFGLFAGGANEIFIENRIGSTRKFALTILGTD